MYTLLHALVSNLKHAFVCSAMFTRVDRAVMHIPMCTRMDTRMCSPVYTTATKLYRPPWCEWYNLLPSTLTPKGRLFQRLPISCLLLQVNGTIYSFVQISNPVCNLLRSRKMEYPIYYLLLQYVDGTIYS